MQKNNGLGENIQITHRRQWTARGWWVCAMGGTPPTSRVESCEPLICLMVIEREGCWVPVVKERLGCPLIIADRSALDFGYQREDQPTKPTIEMYASTTRRNMLGVKERLGRPLFLIVEGSACWTPVTKERFD